MRYFIRNIGYFIWGMVTVSVILSALGLSGLAPHDTLFMSIWVLFLSLVLFMFIGSLHYSSFHWTILSISMAAFSVMMLADHFMGGGLLLPPLTRRILCLVAIMYSICGLLLFYLLDRKKEALTSRRKSAILGFALSILVCSAIGLSSAPLWAALIPLYAGFGILYYRFRVMLFWVPYRRKGIGVIFDDNRNNLP